MILPRLIPTLLLDGQKLVKTVKFNNGKYIGDPVNAIKLFNDLEVDELAILDIRATQQKRVNYQYLRSLANECFVPLAYGGGIRDIDDIRRIFEIGFEKVILNSQAYSNPKIIEEAARTFGSQSIVGSIDYKKRLFGGRKVFINSGTMNTNTNPFDFAMDLQNRGCGELLVTSIDHEGSLSGMDFEFIRKVSNDLEIPVIANGGARNLDDWVHAIKSCGASAVAAGSMHVYHGRTRGILINYPTRREMKSKYFSNDESNL